jgi:hypothetical protein
MAAFIEQLLICGSYCCKPRPAVDRGKVSNPANRASLRGLEVESCKVERKDGMFNWLVKWGVKKYVLEIVNKALDAYNVNVTRSRAIVSVYIRKIEALLAFLKSLDSKLEDNVITNDEADALTDEAATLGR